MKQYFMHETVTGLILIFFTLSSHAASNIQINNAWINEAPPTMKILAAYLTIENTSNSDIILDRIESPAFETVEMHRSIVEDDVARMIKQNNLSIQANSQTVFEPGGLHLMLINPDSSKKQGDITALIFYFSDGSILSVDAIVKKASDQTLHHH